VPNGDGCTRRVPPALSSVPAASQSATLAPPPPSPVARHKLAGTLPFDDDTYFFDCAVRLDVGDDHRALPAGQQRTDIESE
jgi:hypothetical protein